jgi:uncharacterized membrane protein YkoI
MKLLGSVATVLCMMAVLITPAWSDEKGKGKKDEVKEAVEMATAAKITIDQAIKTASEKVSGKVIEAELEKKSGRLVWEVEIVTADNKLMEILIDADSGTVVNVSEEGLKHERKH